MSADFVPEKLPDTLLIPNWREIDRAIPIDFRDDGSSDPVLVYLLGLVRFIPWARFTLADINEAGRRHDYGYGPARLPGSPYEHVPRVWWDTMYRINLRDTGHPVISELHWRALHTLGQTAWDNNARKMREWGWLTYQDFLNDPDHSYTADRNGMRDGKCASS